MINQQSIISAVSFGLIIFFFMGLVTSPALTQNTEPAIKVDNETINKSEIEKRIEQSFKRMKTQYGDRLKDKKTKQMMRRRVRQQVIDQTVEQLILKTNAKQSDISVSKQAIKDRLNSQMKRMGGEERFRNALEKQGMTIEKFREQIREKILIQKFLDEKIGDVEVSDQEAQDYFKNNKDRFKNKSFEEAKNNIKRMIRGQKQKKKRQNLVESLRKESNVEINIE